MQSINIQYNTIQSGSLILCKCCIGLGGLCVLKLSAACCTSIVECFSQFLIFVFVWFVCHSAALITSVTMACVSGVVACHCTAPIICVSCLVRALDSQFRLYFIKPIFLFICNSCYVFFTTAVICDFLIATFMSESPVAISMVHGLNFQYNILTCCFFSFSNCGLAGLVCW